MPRRTKNQVARVRAIAVEVSELAARVREEVVEQHRLAATAPQRVEDGFKVETVTLASVKACNLWVDWMEKTAAGLGDDDLVDVVRRDSPFGTFLLAIHPHEA